MKILVIVAHPDDEVLGMGGTIFKHFQKGDSVHLVYLATGIKSRKKYDTNNKSSGLSNEKEIEILRKNSRKSCDILGVKSSKFYDFPDNEMDSVSLLEITKIVEKEITKVKPQRIYTNHYGDLNVDHRITFQACLTACRPIAKVPELLSFDVLSSTEWNFPYNYNPNYFVDITKQIDKKILAMKQYKGELRNFPHPRSIEALKITAKKWGTVCGRKAAEAFEIIRIIED